MNSKANIDQATVDGFGDEWIRFDQSELSAAEQVAIFNSYFSIFPWSELPLNPVGFDLGCGSGRWAKLVAPRVEKLHCIDPSAALEVARRNLESHNNCGFHSASVDNIPLNDESMDFGYSLGVLHHVPDTQAGIDACVRLLKPGAPFLLYLYYSFDNRPVWFRLAWRGSNVFRVLISRCPKILRYFFTQIFAFLIYFPLARLSRVAEEIGFDVRSFPLSAYRHLSFYTMRTDALDRFGTRLEQRFSQKAIRTMMERAGLERVEFAANEPYWCALGYRRPTAVDAV